MKNKVVIGFIFIFSLFFTNLIPYTLQVTSTINRNYPNEVFELLSLFSSMNYSQYFLIFFNIFIFFTVVKFLNKNKCDDRLVSLFSISFIGLLLLNSGIYNFSSIINQFSPYMNGNNAKEITDYYENLNRFFHWLNIGMITFLSIVLLLIIHEIRYILKTYVILFISTIFLNFMFILHIFNLYIKDVKEVTNDDYIRLFKTNTTITIVLVLAIIIFKVVLISEAVHHTLPKEPKPVSN